MRPFHLSANPVTAHLFYRPNHNLILIIDYCYIITFEIFHSRKEIHEVPLEGDS